jgi:hypothetical protein
MEPAALLVALGVVALSLVCWLHRRCALGSQPVPEGGRGRVDM